MTLRQLFYFKKTAECGNITKAAEELFISQPSLSAALKNLRDEIGIDLLIRNGHQLQLTSAGQLVLEYAGKILFLTQELQEKAEKMRRETEKALRIGYISPLSGIFVPELLSRLERLLPEKPQISAVMLNTHRIAEELLQGSLDLGLCCKIEDASGLVQIPVLEQQFAVVCAHTHPLALECRKTGESAVSLQELSGFDFISYVPEAQISEQVGALFRECGFVPRVRYAMDSEKEILQLVKNNLGVAVIPLTDDVDSSEICCFSIREKQVSRSIYLTYPAQYSCSEAVRNVVRCIREIQIKGELL